MTLLEEIQAVCPLEMIQAAEHGEIAALVSAGRTKVAQKFGGIGLVLESLGPADGAALLDTLQGMTASVPALKWAWYLIERGELDFGSAATRGMIEAIVPSPAKEALLAVAEVPDPITEFDVRCALYADDGTFLG